MALRSRAKTSDTRIKAAKRRTQAMKLRISGLTHREIAAKLKVTEQRVATILKEEIERLNQIRMETAEHMRRLEYDRLDKMLNSVWPKVLKGDCQAISTGISIMNRRARLQGIDLADTDAPAGGNVVINVTERVVTRETLTTNNGNSDAIEADPTACGPKRLPAK